MYGIDLAAWWRTRRWKALLELIDQLPSSARLSESIQNDPEQAALIAQIPKPDDPWAPSFRDFDLDATLLREIRELLVQLIRITIGSSAPKIKPFPVPVTEVDRARKRLDHDYARSLTSRLLPHQKDL